ncbi:MAG: hypothetical protein V4674_01100 [Patescibacteria group bacterium]
MTETSHHRKKELFSQGPRTAREDRRPPLSFSYKILIWCALAASFVLGLSFLARAEGLQLTGVLVRGNSIVPSEEVAQVAEGHLEGFYGYLFPRRNSFLYPRESMREDLLSRFSRFLSVSIEKDDKRNLVIDVVERNLAYLLCDGEGFTAPCYGVDRTGYIFDSAPEFSGGIIFALKDERSLLAATSTPVGRVVLPEEELSRLLGIRDALRETLRAHGAETTALGVRITQDSDYVLVLDTGEEHLELLFAEGDAATFASALDLVLLTPQFERKRVSLGLAALRSIDLRFGKKVYYTFASTTPTE